MDEGVNEGRTELVKCQVVTARIWVVLYEPPGVTEVSMGLEGCCPGCLVSLGISLRDDGV